MLVNSLGGVGGYVQIKWPPYYLFYLAASTGNSNVNGDFLGTGEGGSDGLADCDSRASDNLKIENDEKKYFMSKMYWNKQMQFILMEINNNDFY